MENPKPISTIRKAIKGISTELSANDGIFDKNSNENDAKALKILREAKNQDSDVYNKLLEVFANSHELKDLLGAEKFFAAMKIIKGITEDIVGNLNPNHTAISHQEPENPLKGAFIELELRVRNDPSLISLFKGKEYLIEDLIGHLRKEFSLIQLKSANS